MFNDLTGIPYEEWQARQELEEVKKENVKLLEENLQLKIKLDNNRKNIRKLCDKLPLDMLDRLDDIDAAEFVDNSNGWIEAMTLAKKMLKEEV